MRKYRPEGDHDEKTYCYTRQESTHTNTLFIEGTARKSLPLVLGGDTNWPLMSVAFAILLDYFGDEPDAEMKARMLARGLVQHLRKLPDNFSLTENQLNNVVISLFVSAKEMINEQAEVEIEFLGGQRR